MDETKGKAQLALDFFEGSQGKTPVCDQPAPIGYSKSYRFTDITDLSLKAMRALDVMLYLVAKEPVATESYRYPSRFFMWMMDSLGTNNYAHLRSALRETQKAAIQIESYESTEKDPGWVSISIVNAVALKGGYVYFEINPKVNKIIRHPEYWYFNDLRWVWSSKHAQLLYQNIIPYLRDGDGWTPWYSVPDMKQRLGVKGSYDDYGIFNRDVLKKSMTIVRDTAAIDIELQTKNQPGSKKVSEVRFRAKKADVQAKGSALEVLQGLYYELKERIGLSDKDVEEVAANRAQFTDERITKAVEYTMFQVKHGQISKSHRAYFFRALREGWVLSEADRIRMQQKVDAGQVRVYE